MTIRKIGYDFEISDEFWMKIEPLLLLPKPKKKSGRLRKDDRKIMVLFFISFALGVNILTPNPAFKNL